MKIRNSILAIAAISLLCCSCGNRPTVEEKTALFEKSIDSLSMVVRAYVSENMTALMLDDSLAVAGYEERIASITDLTKETFLANRKNELGAKAFCILSQIIEDEDELTALSRKLSKKVIEGDEAVSEIVKSLETRSLTSVGKMFTDFEVSTVEGFYADGNEITGTAKLSDYVGKGKYVLVDFWASWCRPCRAEIPNIKKAYETFPSEKFEILSIAVWDRAEDSFEAIEEEGLSWNQMVLSDESKAVPTEAYGIQGIPQIMLFGPDGTILKRDLRGDAISEAIAEALAD